MKIYHFHKEQLIPVSIEEAWQFFSMAANLEKITPPGVKFETVTQLGNARIYDGMNIKYKLRPMLNIPMSWETEIMKVNAPYRFVDKQLKGPYAFWEHEHTFETVTGGVKMIDDVKYALPFGWLGQAMQPVFIKPKLEEIFMFREAAVKKLLGEYTAK